MGQIFNTALKEVDSTTSAIQDGVTTPAQQASPTINAAFLMRIVVAHIHCSLMVVVYGKVLRLAVGPPTQIANAALVILQILILLQSHMMNSLEAAFTCY